MPTYVDSGSWPRPTQQPPLRKAQLLPATSPAVDAPFTGTGTLTADVTAQLVAPVDAAFTGTGTLTATAVPADAVVDSISRIRGAATPQAVMGITAGPAVAGIEPFTTQTITATITGTTGGVTYTITQTIGPPVHITGGGPTWTYRTPGVPTTATAAQTRFLITATKDGFTTTTATVDHYIYPAAAMDYDDTGAARGISIQT